MKTAVDFVYVLKPFPLIKYSEIAYIPYENGNTIYFQAFDILFIDRNT